MSFPLLKHFMKKNWAIWMGFLAFLLMEILACIFMMEEISSMGGIMGIGVSGASTLSFVAELLPLYCSMFVMAYCIFIVFRLLYKPVDSTSLSSHLSSGITRKKYITTAAAFMVLSVLAMFVIVFVV